VSRLRLFYECGCCGGYHETCFDGDCRQDDARFTEDQLDTKFGVAGWILVEYEWDEDGAEIIRAWEMAV
jgi:hypothetical protein